MTLPDILCTSLMTPVGDLTLFEADAALCVVEWGTGPQGIETPLLKEAKHQLSAYFKGQLTQFDLPLAPEGTDHQQKVWRLMQTIPYGTTLTYGDLAQEINSSPRAVGGACGRNPLPIFIPCHRVTGQSGTLTGYSGGDGIETKERLLTLEKAVATQSIG